MAKSSSGSTRGLHSLVRARQRDADHRVENGNAGAADVTASPRRACLGSLFLAREREQGFVDQRYLLTRSP